MHDHWLLGRPYYCAGLLNGQFIGLTILVAQGPS